MTKVYWIAKYRQRWSTSPHSHSFWQLLVPLSDEGYLLTGEEKHSALRGNVMLICPGVLHGVECDEEEPKFIDVKFAVTDDALEAELRALPDIITLPDFESCLSKLEGALEEAIIGDGLSGKAVNMFFSLFLVSLLRSYQGASTVAVSHGSIPGEGTDTYKGVLVSALVRYISGNFDRIISLDDLSSLVHVSKATLNELFRENFGTTPIKYINELRMKKAMELLEQSDMSIGEISELVGFQSIHYFSRSFKEHEGVSPSEYRREKKNSMYITLERSPDY
jgi:AraC-like DNA-binding protein